MSCMVTVFACDLSMEYNIPLINRNMAGALLMIDFFWLKAVILFRN